MAVPHAHFEVAGVMVGIPELAAAVVVSVALTLLTWRIVKRRRVAAVRQAEAVAQYTVAMEEYEAAVQEWQQRREELHGLFAVAREATPAIGEHVYCALPVTLLGSTAVEAAGTLINTSKGLVFDGPGGQEWSWTQATFMRHIGEDRTILQFEGDNACVVVKYAEAPITRLYLDLAASVTAGSRQSFVRTVAQTLNDHEMRRPPVPLPPAPAAGLGNRAGSQARRWHEVTSAAAEALQAEADASVVTVPIQPLASKELALPKTAARAALAS